jgi:hypothetical protein
MRRTITGHEMESRIRQALVVCELTEGIERSNQQNSKITCVEVVAALLATADRFLKLEMTRECE